VKLSSRVGEQPRQIPEALDVSQPCGVALEDDRPVLTFVPEDTLTL